MTMVQQKPFLINIFQLHSNAARIYDYGATKNFPIFQLHSNAARIYDYGATKFSL